MLNVNTRIGSDAVVKVQKSESKTKKKYLILKFLETMRFETKTGKERRDGHLTADLILCRDKSTVNVAGDFSATTNSIGLSVELVRT